MRFELCLVLLPLVLSATLGKAPQLAAPSVNCLDWMLANHYCDWQCNSGTFEFDGGDCTDPPLVCPAKWIGDTVCQPLCDTVSLLRDGGDCADKSGCLARMLGNGYCDPQCNDEFHNFDSGDCIGLPVFECTDSMVGNRYCDEVCNNAENDWDGDDCSDDPTLCRIEQLGDLHCDLPCNNEFWFFDAGDCDEVAICQKWMLGNGYCDWQCQDEEHDYDNGDCPEPTPAECMEWMAGNGYCDEPCDSAAFEWDGGDCLDTSCLAIMLGDGVCHPQCNDAAHSYDLGDCHEGVSNCFDFMLGNSYCDWQCNDLAHEWDGHDCCPPPPDECLDRMAGNGYCDEVCNTEQYGWDSGECTFPPSSCLIENIGNHKCDELCNTEQWHWDAGDCDEGLTPTCLDWMLGNSYCDPQCDSPDFEYDSGDCEVPKHDTCTPAMIGNAYCDWQCDFGEFEWDDGDCDDPPTKCLIKMVGDGMCDDLCNTVELKHDGGDCSRSCLPWMLENSYCDWQCDIPEFDFDNGACDTEPPKCMSWMAGNGYCDEACDTLAFNWDGGDCEDEPVLCRAKMIGNGRCDEVCNVEDWEWDGGECREVTGCLPFMLGNKYCDSQCNVAAFDFDHGDCASSDCESETCETGFELVDEECIKICSPEFLGNGICESWCNRGSLAFDGGDCDGCNDRATGIECVRACESQFLGDGYCDSLCNTVEYGYDGGDCSCQVATVGDGFCDEACNNEENNFDGGDCIVCDPGYIIVDGVCILPCSEVAGNGICDEDCNSISTDFDGGDCPILCDVALLGDGACDAACNTAENGFDGGDCIVCEEGLEKVDGVCVEVCDPLTIADGVCNEACNTSEFEFDGADCIFCDVGYIKVGFDCVKVCNLADIGDGLCNDECNFVEFEFDNGDCVVCDPGYHHVGLDCVVDCDAATIGDGVCSEACNVPQYDLDGGDCDCGFGEQLLDNICQCMDGFTLFQGNCFQILWYSEETDVSADSSLSDSDVATRLVRVIPEIAGGWQSVPGAEWVWDTTAGQGTFAFVEYMNLPASLQGYVSSAKVTVSVDENYKLSMNGNVLTENAGDWFAAPITWDILPYLIYSDETKNAMRLDATNLSGPGGITWKIELKLSSCNYGEEEVNGVCQCKADFQSLNGQCYQTVWYSERTDVSADTSLLSTEVASRPVTVIQTTAGGWQSVPGAQWVWDSTSGTGTFAFVEYMKLPALLYGHVSSASVTVSVDENYKLTMNDKVLTENAGDWFAAPITWDILPYLIYSDETKNAMRLDATNLSGPGGITWKIELKLSNCNYGEEEVNGVCQCKADFQSLNGQCYQTVWYSEGTDVSADTSLQSNEVASRPVTVIKSTAGGWQSVPGAQWVWDSTSGTGTFAFVEYMNLPELLYGHISSAKVTVSVDENYKLIMNEKVLTEKAGDWFAAPISWDILPYLIYSDEKKNAMRLDATNLSGPGGITWKVELKLSNCNYGEEEVNGVCYCKGGFQKFNGQCYQTVWYSEGTDVSADTSLQSTQVAIRPVNVLQSTAGGWQSIPGAQWVWDSTSGTGTFAFVEYFDIPASLRDNLASAKVTVSVDENYKLIVNDQVLTEKAGDWFAAPITWDILPYLVYTDEKKNTMRLDGTNLSGPGGITWKIEITLK